MDYSIIQVGLNDKELLRGVNRLLGETFGRDMPDDKLEKCTWTNSSSNSLYLTAIQDDEIIGFNAFISHDLFLNGLPINCYQSCWTATSNAHRGKKIFQNLINEAKEILLSRGAAFIFGFANENSHPIFINKLGFKETPSLKWQVANLKMIRDLYLHTSDSEYRADQKEQIFQNDKQLIELKTKKYQDDLLVIEHDESLIWGVPRINRKFGIDLKYFEIGGFYIGDSKDIKPLFEKLWRTKNKVRYFQLTTTLNNSLNKYLKNLKPAQTNDLIVFDLNLDTGRDITFNFFGGVKDVF